MKHEIKFRGLRTDSKVWVYGYYYEYSGIHVICYQDHSGNSITDNFHLVIPATVCQLHNALTKKAGKEVYVGDKIKYRLAEGMGLPKSDFKECIVETVEDNFHYYIDIEVIGNIHEK